MVSRLALAAGGLILLLVPSLNAQNYPVAGIEPDRQPAGFAVISKFVMDDDWNRRALAGVVSLYRDSLRFLEDQGARFQPFMHPGMSGPYDLRGWHGKE